MVSPLSIFFVPSNIFSTVKLTDFSLWSTRPSRICATFSLDFEVSSLGLLSNYVLFTTRPLTMLFLAWKLSSNKFYPLNLSSKLISSWKLSLTPWLGLSHTIYNLSFTALNTTLILYAVHGLMSAFYSYLWCLWENWIPRTKVPARSRSNIWICKYKSMVTNMIFRAPISQISSTHPFTNLSKYQHPNQP